REIEVAGQRLAVTFSEKGLSIRPVGSRKPPREVTWADLMSLLAAQPPAGTAPAPPAPAAEQATAAAPAKPEKPPAPPAGGVSALLARLERWLKQHRPRYLKGLQPGASAVDLEALGPDAPADLRTLLAWHNGQGDDAVGCFEGSWNLMSAREIIAARQ